MMTYMSDVGLITLAYNGKEFHGYAKQDGLRTVQGELERALETIFRTPIDTTCAGRTDAGVHASGQCVSFSLESLLLPENPSYSLLSSLNALTPDDITVQSFEIKPEGFSARFSAKERSYCYRVSLGHKEPIFTKDFVYHLKRSDLNIEAMRTAAQCLVGEHDFTSFCAAEASKEKSTIRSIFSIDIKPASALGEDFIEFRIVGNAFLHNMIRIIVGTLVQVGLGKHEPEWVAGVLAQRDRNAAGETLPPQGLTFQQVRY